MDTLSQAITSLNAKTTASASQLSTIATAAQAVEQITQGAASTLSAAPTGAQKLQAAVSIATALDPTLASITTPLEAIFSAVVGVLNLFGIFKKSTAPTVQPMDGGGPVEPPQAAA